MGTINLTLKFSHSQAIAHKVRYARIDNVVTPVWVNVSPNPTVSPTNIAVNVPNGQYTIESTPVYADGRVCDAKSYTTAPCPGLLSINAVIQGGNIIVSYLAPSTVPKVKINVRYPNGGGNSLNYINNGNDIIIPVGNLVDGDYFVSGQSVCDEASEFYSTPTAQVVVTKRAVPSLTSVSETDTGGGGTRTQIFNIGANVSAGNRYVLTVYSHDVTVVAVVGDSPASIANKLKDAINATTTTQWNDHGSAPAIGTNGYPPVATSNGSQVIIVLNYQNSFAANAYES